MQENEIPLLPYPQINKSQSSSPTSKGSQLPVRQPSPFYYNVKLTLTLLTIIFSSYQVYDITTNKLEHSRNFIRYLHYYLLEHEDFDIYWAGQTGLNYPIHQYYQVNGVQQFLQRLEDVFLNIGDSAYGEIDLEKFTELDEHTIYLQTKDGDIQSFPYIIADGFQTPFNLTDLTTIKDSILRSQQINIVYEPFKINSHQWHVIIQITDYSDCSIFVQIHAKQSLSLWYQHLSTFVLGLVILFVLIKEYLSDPQSLYANIPDYMLSILLINTFLFSFDQNAKYVNNLIIVDGIQCLIAWLLILKFMTKQDDYHISFLLKKSYILVGRIFISFGPVFIAFSIFAYVMFCRQAWQFSTFRRTFLNLFYISYYNMTYESFIVTSRTNPISMIFFFTFVILFTMCVYSGMLVAVFCSYVWNKRESKIKQDIINNLKIQCSECDHKYKYIDCLKMAENNPKVKMSFVMQVDFQNQQERYKYKQALQSKIKNLIKSLIKTIQSNKNLLKSQKDQNSISRVKIKQDLKRFQKEIKLILRQIKQSEIIESEVDSSKGQKQKNQ